MKRSIINVFAHLVTGRLQQSLTTGSRAHILLGMNELEAFWLSPGDWRSYEHYVAGYLASLHPEIEFEFDVKVRGAKSGILRQIDVLANATIPVAIECKHVSRKIDIKCIEAFLSMLDDLKINRGILITTKGYSRGAINRARNDPRNIDLKILTPERLSDYQFAVPPLIWRDSLGVWLQMPTGWIVDFDPGGFPEPPSAFFYRLGHRRETAIANAEICYVNFLTPLTGESSLSATAEPHAQALASDDPNIRFDFEHLELADSNGVSRPALLRLAQNGRSGARTEHALYVDYGSHILLLVLLSEPGRRIRKPADLFAFYKGSFTLKIDDQRVGRVD